MAIDDPRAHAQDILDWIVSERPQCRRDHRARVAAKHAVDRPARSTMSRRGTRLVDKSLVQVVHITTVEDRYRPLETVVSRSRVDLMRSALPSRAPCSWVPELNNRVAQGFRDSSIVEFGNPGAVVVASGATANHGSRPTHSILKQPFVQALHRRQLVHHRPAPRRRRAVPGGPGAHNDLDHPDSPYRWLIPL